MTEAFVKRPLQSVLHNGDIIGHFTKLGDFFAEYRDGYLHPYTEKVKKDGKFTRIFDKDNIFDSATSFCNFHLKSKANGWREARVLRDGQWIRLGELEADEHKVSDTIIDQEDMPPKKVANHIMKTKKPETKLTPIVAIAIESNNDPIEIDSLDEITLIQIKINETIYLLDSNKKKLYEKWKDGSVGKYVGRYNTRIAGKIDRTQADSDDESSLVEPSKA